MCLLSLVDSSNLGTLEVLLPWNREKDAQSGKKDVL